MRIFDADLAEPAAVLETGRAFFADYPEHGLAGVARDLYCGAERRQGAPAAARCRP